MRATEHAEIGNENVFADEDEEDGQVVKVDRVRDPSGKPLRIWTESSDPALRPDVRHSDGTPCPNWYGCNVCCRRAWARHVDEEIPLMPQLGARRTAINRRGGRSSAARCRSSETSVPSRSMVCRAMSAITSTAKRTRY